jgi:hypothetical protein
MCGHGLQQVCVVIGISILVSLVLVPGISYAVQVGHIKNMPAPIIPEIKCGEPGEDPNFSTLGTLHMTGENCRDSMTNDPLRNRDSIPVVALLYFLRSMKFVIGG